MILIQQCFGRSGSIFRWAFDPGTTLISLGLSTRGGASLGCLVSISIFAPVSCGAECPKGCVMNRFSPTCNCIFWQTPWPTRSLAMMWISQISSPHPSPLAVVRMLIHIESPILLFEMRCLASRSLQGQIYINDGRNFMCAN